MFLKHPIDLKFLNIKVEIKQTTRNREVNNAGSFTASQNLTRSDFLNSLSPQRQTLAREKPYNHGHTEETTSPKCD